MTPKEYFQHHSLSEDFLKNRLGWAWNDKLITIPIYDKDGKLLYCKYRHMDFEDKKATGDKTAKKFSFDEGSHPTLYGTHLMKDNPMIVLCEGEPDCARLLQEKIPAVTGTGGVGKFDPIMAEMLIGKEVHVCLDTDQPGQDGIKGVIQTLTNVGIKSLIIKLPEGVKDVCEYFAQGKTKEDFDSLPHLTEEEWIVDRYAKEFPVIDNKEFMSTEYPKPTWLLNKFICPTGLSLLVGEGGVGKTSISYSIIKAVTEGSKWIGQIQATKGRVLILDKDNEKSDIKRNLFAQKVTSPDIYHYSLPRKFTFFNKDGSASDQAIYVNALIKKNNINVVLIDSLVDFYEGSENDSVDAANNVNAWETTFENCAILMIHHENKPQMGMKRSRIHSVRGSSHLFNAAQTVINFNIPDEEDPTKICVEHVKVRGTRKRTPFEIRMVIEDDPTTPGETVITGFEFLGEIEIVKRKMQEAKDKVLEILKAEPEKWFTNNEIVFIAGNIIGARNTKMAIIELRNDRVIAYDKNGNSYLYKHLENIAEEDEIKDEKIPF